MRKLCLVALVALGLTACADERPPAETVSVIAADGAVVQQGDNSLSIPPTALAMDTDVVIREVPTSDFPDLEGASKVIVLDPAGTQLSTPATFTVKIDKPGSKIQMMDDGWRNVTPESATDTSVVISVSRFAPIAVVEPSEVTGGGNKITGTVSWGSGDPVDQAPVELWVVDSASPLATVMTGTDGTYTFADVSAGSYVVMVDFECKEEVAAVVTDSEATVADITLCGG